MLSSIAIGGGPDRLRERTSNAFFGLGDEKKAIVWLSSTPDAQASGIRTSLRSATGRM